MNQLEVIQLDSLEDSDKYKINFISFQQSISLKHYEGVTSISVKHDSKTYMSFKELKPDDKGRIILHIYKMRGSSLPIATTDDSWNFTPEVRDKMISCIKGMVDSAVKNSHYETAIGMHDITIHKTRYLF